eukprot:2148993-Pyramimonas_sp.AAC.1
MGAYLPMFDLPQATRRYYVFAKGDMRKGALRSVNLLLDSITQCVRVRVCNVVHQHAHCHVAHPWKECGGTITRLCAMRVLPIFYVPVWRAL